jgi:hypothetical protein
MLNARFVPLESWPGKATPRHMRQASRFQSPYARTLDLLEFELKQLHAKEILVQAFFSRDQLRNDEWPKTAAVPKDVGVIVSFQSPKGPLSFPCDTFNAFDCNLRAIALALQALRAVDRYGVTQNNEQYKGWAQIAAPADQPFGSKEEAATFIITQAYPSATDRSGFGTNMLIVDQTLRESFYRLAARRLHPDANGGSHELFVRLQAAKRLLET